MNSDDKDVLIFSRVSLGSLKETKQGKETPQEKGRDLGIWITPGVCPNGHTPRSCECRQWQEMTEKERKNLVLDKLSNTYKLMCEVVETCNWFATEK